MQQVSHAIVGQIHGENTFLTGSMKLCVPVTRQKCNCPRYKEILDGYDDFSTYAIVGSLRDTTTFGCLDI